ncbi:class A beta-lactamase-related serine hydrolase [Deinococcus taeanensis]|uniref:class A beta-lactamase-related serine hydrolase n=1 Tax=Deinococcus taeanensis TaxID=2737050 RepID=UPI001CDCE398|nr:class A beta-lactamase-related serine hydrolase [Deinococcus taeanensis]UBV41868.1 class A beta-lactamase-related serine hydrolase [Deinococcus taeanensis]
MTHTSVRRPFRSCWWYAALAVLLLDLPGAAAQTAGLPAAFAACQEGADAPAAPALPVAGPLPGGVSGRVAFQATLYDRTGAPLREVTLGDVMPLASAFKTTVVAGALRDVDAGRLRLRQLFTTAENRSMEGVAPGQSALRSLLERAIRPVRPHRS